MDAWERWKPAMGRFALFAFVASAVAGCRTASPDGAVFLPLLDPPATGLEEVRLTAAYSGSLVVDRGCVRVAGRSGHGALTVLWHRGTELGRDASGPVLRNAHSGRVYPFGRPIRFGGGEMSRDFAERQYPAIAERCGPPYASGWLPE